MDMEQYNTIVIWTPRWRDKKVLVKDYRIKPGKNKVIFRDWKADKALVMDGDRMRAYPMESHGVSGVHAIPLSDFENVSDEKQLKLV